MLTLTKDPIEKLSLREIRSVDKSRLCTEYDKWPIWSKETMRIDVNYPEVKGLEGIIFTGMGASGIPGEILQDWLFYHSNLPIFSVHGYHLPQFAGKRTLVVPVSASGNTEETLSTLYEAMNLGAPVTAISSGGLMEKVCRKHRVPLNKFPRPLVPRASLPYMFYIAGRIALESIGDSKMRRELKSTPETLMQLKEKISADVSFKSNAAKKLADWLEKGLPYIYVPFEGKAVANRFQASLNENAKLHAVARVLPELCHNEIVAWSEPMLWKPKPVLLRFPGELSEVTTRFEFVKELIESTGSEFREVKSAGESLIAQIISSIYFLDYVTVYTAVAREVDPTPTENIDHLKERLREQVNRA